MPPEGKTPSMKEKLFQLAVSNMVSNAINVGNRLNLFKKLAEISNEKNPVLPEQLAEAAGCKERYVREWCNCMACGEIIEVNGEERFWIKEEDVEVLASGGNEVTMNGIVAPLLEPLDQLIECFKKDGPLGLEYTQFSKFQSVMSEMTKGLQVENLVSDMVKALGNGIYEKLESGNARVLDVGCGTGFHLSLLAEHYPNTTFVGLDIGSDALEMARARKKKSGESFENLDFVKCDASSMPTNWEESFDLVLQFDSCHDMCRPDLCVQEVHRVLKHSGTYAMIEIIGSSNVHTDKATMGPSAAFLYGISLFHCLPVGSNHPTAFCLGSMWGQKRAMDLLNKHGFPEVKTVATPYFPVNVIYCAQKE